MSRIHLDLEMCRRPLKVWVLATKSTQKGFNHSAIDRHGDLYQSTKLSVISVTTTPLITSDFSDSCEIFDHPQGHRGRGHASIHWQLGHKYCFPSTLCTWQNLSVVVVEMLAREYIIYKQSREIKMSVNTTMCARCGLQPIAFVFTPVELLIRR